jgi:hypothetical protein
MPNIQLQLVIEASAERIYTARAGHGQINIKKRNRIPTVDEVIELYNSSDPLSIE